MNSQIAFFTALSDPTRFRIVEALSEGEKAVGEIVDGVSIHQSGVSRHLGILNDLGIVQVRAAGQRRLYSLRPEPFRDFDTWNAKYRALWEARLDRFGDALRRDTAADVARRGKRS